MFLYFCRLTRAVASAYFDRGEAVFIDIFRDISRWPSPFDSAGLVVELPLLSSAVWSKFLVGDAGIPVKARRSSLSRKHRVSLVAGVV